MTLILELDVDSVKINQQAKYLQCIAKSTEIWVTEVWTTDPSPSVSARHVSGGGELPPGNRQLPPEIFCRPQFLERVIPYTLLL